jgi:ketosteroid isomerase-like protein
MSTATQPQWTERRSEEVQSVLTRARVAVLRRDRVTLEQVLAPDYLCVYPDGRMLSKAERIRSAVAGAALSAQVALMESRDLRIRFYGPVCIVTEVIRQATTRQGAPAIDEWVATSVLHEGEDGRWLIVSGQLTAIRSS